MQFIKLEKIRLLGALPAAAIMSSSALAVFGVSGSAADWGFTLLVGSTLLLIGLGLAERKTAMIG